jgi:hypothetical protein
VLDANRWHGTACPKQWHTLVRNAGNGPAVQFFGGR